MFPFCGLFSGSLIWKFPLLWIFFFEMVLENVKITGRTGYNSISQSLAASSWQIWDSVCVYACVYTCVCSMWVCTCVRCICVAVCACIFVHVCVLFVAVCIDMHCACVCVHVCWCMSVCWAYVYVPCTCMHVCACMCITAVCIDMHCVCWWYTYASSVYMRVCLYVHLYALCTCVLVRARMHVCTYVHVCAGMLHTCALHAWPVCHLPRAPLSSTVRYRMQQPPADPPWPRTGAPEEVPCSAAGGRLCQGPQAAGHFPEEWTARYLFYPDKKCYFQRGTEARGSENAAARLL